MTSCLIGYTGFVGSNLDQQYSFTDRYNSKNIAEIAGKTYDLCICAGVKAQKWVANQQPEHDLSEIKALINHLKSAKIKQFVLISTIDVYPYPIQVDEDSVIDRNQHHAYGLNRLYLEEWVAKYYEKHLIIRLPGLFGYNIKKNFIYDIMHPVPMLFNEVFFAQLISKLDHQERLLIEKVYPKSGINYVWDKTNEQAVNDVLQRYGISSLMFTDAEDVFQYYDLRELKKHITICLENNIRVVNFASEPVMAKALYAALFERTFENHLDRPKQNYDMHSKHAALLGGFKTYLHTKDEIIEQIRAFIVEQAQ